MHTLFAPNGNHIEGIKAKMVSYLEVDKEGQMTDRFVFGDKAVPVYDEENNPIYVDCEGEEWKRHDVIEDPGIVTADAFEGNELFRSTTFPIEEALDGVHDDRQLIIDYAAKSMGLDVPDEADDYHWLLTIS